MNLMPSTAEKERRRNIVPETFHFGLTLCPAGPWGPATPGRPLKPWNPGKTSWKNKQHKHVEFCYQEHILTAGPGAPSFPGGPCKDKYDHRYFWLKTERGVLLGFTDGPSLPSPAGPLSPGIPCCPRGPGGPWGRKAENSSESSKRQRYVIWWNKWMCIYRPEIFRNASVSLKKVGQLRTWKRKTSIFWTRGHQSCGHAGLHALIAFSAFKSNELFLLFLHDRRFFTNQVLHLNKKSSPANLQIKLPLVLGGPEPPVVPDLPVRLKKICIHCFSTENIFIVKTQKRWQGCSSLWEAAKRKTVCWVFSPWCF